MNKVEKVARILASENSVNGYDEDDWGVWASQAKRIVMVAKWSLSDIAMIGVWFVACSMFGGILLAFGRGVLVGLSN